MSDQADTKSMDDIMALCKRRGFIYQASEIYGGINGFWDYGPLGAQLKKNLRDAWWTDVVMRGCNGKAGPDGKPVEIVPLDSCIIQNPKVWEASGHVGGFNDPMVDCRECKSRYRFDHLEELVRESRWFKSIQAYGGGITGQEVVYSLLYRLPEVSQNLVLFSGVERSDYDDPDYQGPPEDTRERLIEHLEAFAAIGRGKKSKCPWIAAARRATATGDDLSLYNRVAAVLARLLTVKQMSPEQVLDFLRGTWQRMTGVVVYMPASETPGMWIDEAPTGWGPCPNCMGRLTAPRPFNLMFKTFVGATSAQTDDNAAYLRPETAQGIFINFKNVVDTTRVGVPFGIAQTGKAFRNEVTPRNFTFRSREFEQMEIEFFCHPDDAEAWYAFWRDWRMQWWQELGLAGDNLILREHDSDELAHYAKDGAGTSDVEYRFPFTAPGYGELEGVAHRSDFDLKQHQEHSKKKMEYFDPGRGELAKNGQPKGEWFLPHVIEPSAGLDRGVLALICEAYTPDPERASGVYMKFNPRVAPIKAAVFPLVKKDGMPEKAAELTRSLRARFGHLGFIETDEKQSIGKRYARMDEAGCPYCFTIDGDTMADGTVTVRERDTLAQERLAMEAVPGWLAERLGV